MKTEKQRDMAYRGWMNAITFAEAGEWETARGMMPPTRPAAREVSRLFRTFAAAALAEEGLALEAVRFMEQGRMEKVMADDFLKVLGLEGFRLTYGVLAVERQ